MPEKPIKRPKKSSWARPTIPNPSITKVHGLGEGSPSPCWVDAQAGRIA